MSTTTDRDTSTPEIRRSRRNLVLGGGIAAIVVFSFAAYLFQPWALFTNKTVDEALPEATAPANPNPVAPVAPNPAAPTPAPSAPALSNPAPPAPAPAGPQTLGSGAFRSYEHSTSGTAKLVKLADGRVFVRLQNFNTSNGPDVKVWLTGANVEQADKSKDAAYVNLGDLKANNGNQNYQVPAGADLSKYKTVVIWCDRFSVAFGAASIT